MATLAKEEEAEEEQVGGGFSLNKTSQLTERKLSKNNTSM